MKKAVAFVLALICAVGMTGCQRNQPDFEDFQEYEGYFTEVKDFLIDFHDTHNNAAPLIVHLNSQFLTINGDEISDSSIKEAVKAIYDKGFTYIEVNDDCFIFWEDETGYYGVIWSLNPKESINSIIGSSRPYMKSRKLAREWYEVGALDSI